MKRRLNYYHEMITTCFIPLFLDYLKGLMVVIFMLSLGTISSYYVIISDLVLPLGTNDIIIRYYTAPFDQKVQPAVRLMVAILMLPLGSNGSYSYVVMRNWWWLFYLFTIEEGNSSEMEINKS